MATNVVNIRTIAEDGAISDKNWSLSQFNYVEDLIHHILDTYRVKPVYYIIYGLRFVDEPSIWLATNTKINQLIDTFREKQVKAELELRIRFRVTNLKFLLYFDNVTFAILLRQIRHDFLYTRFTDEKRDFILVNDAVLGLISTDLAIYAKENSICSADLFNLVNPKDFTPKAAAKWQRSLISHLVNKLNIRKSVETCMQKDLNNLKIGYLELFLQDVCPNYAAEFYQVICIDNSDHPQFMEIGIRYNEKLDDSTCIIEHRLPHKHAEMTILSDIDTISYGTLRDDTVEINRSNGRPLRIKFKSVLESKSFLSLIEGYYRLMRKWHFNFCREVVSPELIHLKSIKCHGPIGQESSRLKLLKNRRIGAFLVRKCEKMRSKYIIDVIISSRAILSIELQYDLRKEVFKKDLRKNLTTRSIDKRNNEVPDTNVANHDAQSIQDEGLEKRVERSDSQVLVQLLLNQEEYSTLKSLVEDVQIKIDKQKHPPLQLKHWLSPSEYDDYPLLLVAASRKKLIKLVDGLDSSIKSVTQLPIIIPPNLLEFSPIELTYSNNLIQSKVANLKGEGDVVMKGLFNTKFSAWFKTQNIDLPNHHSVILNLYLKQNLLVKELEVPAPLIRLQDWLFIKSPLFAKTFGLCLDGYYLIQEYFHEGSLDTYLAQDQNVTEAIRRSVSYQLAHALLFLQEQQIIHGKIRCHNIYIKHFSPMQVKLSDPLGTIDCHNDRAFMPPMRECFSTNGRISINQYVTGIDVWAVGTTLWQIYSKGAKPIAGQIATELFQPESCSDQIWSLIESCWVLDPSFRASPQSIFRDISNTFVWERENHNYDYIFNLKEQCDQALDENLERSTMKDVSFFDPSNVSRGSSQNYGSEANLLSLGSRTDVSRDYNIEAKLCGKSKKKSWKKYLFDKHDSQEVDSVKAPNYTSLSTVSNASSNISSYNETEETSVVLKPQDQIESSKLKLSSEIGRGASGVVFKGFLKSSTEDMVVAVKQINSSCMSEVEDLRREFVILKSLDHDNIVKTYGFVDEANVMLVVEYMPLGSLLSYIKNSSRDHLITMPLKKYALDIARGMEYLESMKIVHRDLALRNILLRNLNQAKISDFGLAHSLGSNNHYKLKTERALPIRWYAPEALSTWTFTHKSDVWSYGIVLWEIYSGGSSPQYPGVLANLSETLKVERLLQPRDCPDQMYHLMLSCWAYEPSDRETFSNICDCLENLQEPIF